MLRDFRCPRVSRLSASLVKWKELSGSNSWDRSLLILNREPNKKEVIFHWKNYRPWEKNGTFQPLRSKNMNKRSQSNQNLSKSRLPLYWRTSQPRVWICQLISSSVSMSIKCFLCTRSMTIGMMTTIIKTSLWRGKWKFPSEKISWLNLHRLNIKQGPKKSGR